MLYSIKNRDDLEKLNELISLQSQVKELHLQDKLGQQNFRQNIKNVFEPGSDKIYKTSEDFRKTKMLASKGNNKVKKNFNGKFSEKKTDRGILASYLLCPLSRIINLEHTSQFNLLKDSDPNRFNALLIKKTTPVTLYDNSLIFHGTDKTFELPGVLLKTKTRKKIM